MFSLVKYSYCLNCWKTTILHFSEFVPGSSSLFPCLNSENKTYFQRQFKVINFFCYQNGSGFKRENSAGMQHLVITQGDRSNQQIAWYRGWPFPKKQHVAATIWMAPFLKEYCWTPGSTTTETLLNQSTESDLITCLYIPITAQWNKFVWLS